MTVYVCVPVTERVESSEKLVVYFTVDMEVCVGKMPLLSDCVSNVI